MQCEKCQRDMTPVHDQPHFHCEDCNLFAFPDALSSPDGLKSLQKETEFNCPVCADNRLKVGEISGSQVCFCDQCRGFVIDQASFGELVSVLRGAYEGPDDVPVMMDRDELNKLCLCPVCHELMETFPYAGPGNVVLDSCRECRLTWLNHGELGKIVRAPGQRQYGEAKNLESQYLRQRLYAQADNDLAAGLFLLGNILG